MKIVILTPVFNDWAALTVLLTNLSGHINHRDHLVELLIVDDGSVEPPEPQTFKPALSYFTQVHLLRLSTNLGHQRAIAVGLTWIHNNIKTDAVLVMDSDGEDRPEDVP